MLTNVVLIVLGVLAVLIAVILILASTKPNTFRVRRTARIGAPPERVFPLINDFHSWAVWSPWEKLDPAMRSTHSGAAAGQGAVYEWVGNNKVGQGRMEILDAQPPSKVTIKLDFVKPFEAHNTAEFTLEAQGSSTNVTWDMHGPQPFMAKVMCLFMNMDQMVGKDFELGLANLRAAAEK